MSDLWIQGYLRRFLNCPTNVHLANIIPHVTVDSQSVESSSLKARIGFFWCFRSLQWQDRLKWEDDQYLRIRCLGGYWQPSRILWYLHGRFRRIALGAALIVTGDVAYLPEFQVSKSNRLGRRKTDHCNSTTWFDDGQPSGVAKFHLLMESDGLGLLMLMSAN